MFWLSFVLICVVLLFSFVIFVGPPYVPTMRKQVEAGLDLLDLKEGQTLLDLGSGDGRVLLAAAKRGLKVVGIELNPLLVIFSYFLTWKYRKQVRILWTSYWGPQWPRADGVFTFMLPKYMSKLDKRIEFWHSKPIDLASFAFSIPDKEPVDSRDSVYLYRYK